MKQTFSKLLAFLMLCLTLSGFKPDKGLDTYEIFLNKKLILKQAVNAPLSLKKLQLSHANSNDQLRIFYAHCMNGGNAGTGRSIAIEDATGNVLKKWAFKDIEKAMEIPVKELLQVEKQHADKILSLHYVSQELAERNMLLASVQFE